MQIAIFIVAILLLAAGFFLGYVENIGAATATYGAAVISLIFAFLPEFKKFKGLGIEAELLDRKIEETDKLLRQLRDITTPIAEMLFSSAARAGRYGSNMSNRQKYELVQKIESELKKCGIDESSLEKAKEDWHYFVIFDLTCPIISKVSSKLQPIQHELAEKIREIKKPLTAETQETYDKLQIRWTEVSEEISEFRSLRHEKNQTVLVDKIRKSIFSTDLLNNDEKKVLMNEIAEDLEDIAHYIKYKDFRRPSTWINNDNE